MQTEPSRVDYSPTGAKMRESWSCKHGPHNLNGPAVIHYDWEVTGNVISKEYWVNGVRHRVSGPAIMEFDPDTGALVYESYWEGGKFISSQAYRLDPDFAEA